MRTIRASEIGSYLYCHRAWWYRKQGIESSNLNELAAGVQIHMQHGRKVLTAGCLRTVAFALMIGSILLLTIYAMQQVLG